MQYPKPQFRILEKPTPQTHLYDFEDPSTFKADAPAIVPGTTATYSETVFDYTHPTTAADRKVAIMRNGEYVIHESPCVLEFHHPRIDDQAE